MYEAKIVLSVVVEARRDAAEVLEPRVQPLDLPAAAVAAQCPAVLRRWLHSVRLVRRDHLDAFRFKFSVERVGVVGAVADQSSGLLSDETRLKSVSDKGDGCVAGITSELLSSLSSFIMPFGNHYLETNQIPLQVASLRANPYPVVRQMVLQVSAFLS